MTQKMDSQECWSYGLIRDMKQTSNHILRNDLAVVIRDKYPKARHHFLVLPWADIDTVYQLTRKDIPLLEGMHQLGTDAIAKIGGQREDFKIGFHMKPSMQRLNLHVISNDFVSDRMKHIKHWNIFHTDLFMPLESILVELKEHDQIKQRSKQHIDNLLNKQPLACHRCDRTFSTMVSLKMHLLVHFPERSIFAKLDNVRPDIA